MKKYKLVLDHIGKFRNCHFDLNDVTIFHGPNEAGKTTIIDALIHCLANSRKNQELENPRHPLLSPVGASMGRCRRWGWLRAELGLGVPGNAEPQLGVGRGETRICIAGLTVQ